jgi:DNA-binding NarL/FixJ family response regulator
MIEERPDWRIVAETDDHGSAVQLIDDLQPDVAIIDIGTPSSNGIETTRRIVRQSPQTQILVLGTYPGDAYVSQVRQAGARGYLLADDANEYLQHAVTALSKGKCFFNNREVTQ